MSEVKLPQDLKLSDGRDVILSDKLHEQLLIVAQCAKSHMIMFAEYENIGAYGTMNVDKLYVPKQTCSVIESDIEVKDVDFTHNTIIVYMYKMQVFISGSYMTLIQKYVEKYDKPIMFIVYNQDGEYKIIMDYSRSKFAKQLEDLVTIVEPYSQAE